MASRPSSRFSALSALSVLRIHGPVVISSMSSSSSRSTPALSSASRLQGKEALNFQISVSLAMALCLLLMVVIIGFPLLVLVGVAALVLTVIAGVKANEGQAYRYPFAWRLVK